jgi:TonB family protein
MTGTLKTGALLLLLGLPLFAQTSKESHPTEAHTSTDTGSGLEILTETQGVDFGPYLAQVQHIVKQNWYSVIPESARSPQLKRGKVVIEFAITKNGQVAGMRYVSSSGDVTLDRAAYGGITASSPFPPLPSKFDGPFVGLAYVIPIQPRSERNLTVPYHAACWFFATICPHPAGGHRRDAVPSHLECRR